MELALGTVVSVEAVADACCVIAKTAARAVTASLVTEALKHIRSRWAFNKGAIRSTATQIAKTSNVLLSIPRGGIIS